jgi:membrane protease YdiL (CAAX protease family)
MATRKDPLRIAIRIALYAVLYFAVAFVFGPLLMWVGGDAGYLPAVTATGLGAALFANWLALRMYEGRALPDVGLGWNADARGHLMWGVLGGAVAALLVIAPPLIAGMARLVRSAEGEPSFGAAAVLFVLLAFGAAGEELFFRGYGFQVLLASAGEWAAVVPVGVVFGLVHMGNPNASALGIVNTVAFGMLFGYAFVRSRDLWLPIGLHFGWNVTLAVFGAGVSGLRMTMTGREMAWTAGRLWSGGEYGPEASVLTSAAVIVLFLALRRAPIRRQPSPLTDPPAESPASEPSSPALPS